jgi:hypothetical protein
MVMDTKYIAGLWIFAASFSVFGQAKWSVTSITKAGPQGNWACEPSIAVDPNSNAVYLGNVLNQLHRNLSNGTSDAWDRGLTLKSSMGVYGDPILAHDHQGRLFYLHLADPSGEGRSGESWLDRIVIQWSDDQGLTWSDGSGIGYNPPKDQDKEGIAIDPSSGALHVSWTEFDSYGRKEPEFKSRIRFSQSYDRGETWSPAITISRNEGNCLDGDLTPEGAIPVVDPSGGVAVVWSYHDTIWMNRSDDDGAITWLANDQPIALQRGGWAHEIPALGRANGMPISYFAPNGTWHLIYGEQDSTKSWVSHATSTDRGLNWSQASRLPVPDSIKHHFMPWFAIDASNGSLHVLAYGQTAKMRTQAWVHRSDDGGLTWSATPLSSAFTPTPRRFFGDYSGIAARNGEVHAVWTEQREGINELVYGRFADPSKDVKAPSKQRSSRSKK